MSNASESAGSDDGSSKDGPGKQARSQQQGPAVLACIPCRKRHLRCPGSDKTKTCDRCLQSGEDCVYVASRRGYKGPTKRPRGESTQLDDAEPTWTMPGMPNNINVSDPLSFDLYDFNYHGGEGFPTPHAQHETGLVRPTSQIYASDTKPLIDLYYSNFHAAHPILLPSHLMAKAGQMPEYLELVMRFIGSHFASNVSNETFRAASAAALADTSVRNPFKVQALLLYAIALHARNEQQEATVYLGNAVDMALELQMHREHFAYRHGKHDPNREESFRRTWWELYIVDGMLAALQHKTSFKTNNVESDVPFPCEDTVFSEKPRVVRPPKASQFYNRIFATEEESFSSFCYRIEAIRILGRILAVSGNLDAHDDKVESVDSSLASWFHHLPAGKSEVVNSEGAVDEMLFQAHFIIHCACIYLHFPRSNFLHSPAATADVNCARRSCQRPCATSASSHHAHAVKAIKAANELSNLASLRLPVNKHTPFFVCGLVLSALVQLSACSDRSCSCLEQHKDRISLAVGVLKSLGNTWSVAQKMAQQVKAVANEVFNLGANIAQVTSMSSFEHTSATRAAADLDLNAFLSSDIFMSGIAATPVGPSPAAGIS